jgi:hypothetical protein
LIHQGLSAESLFFFLLSFALSSSSLAASYASLFALGDEVALLFNRAHNTRSRYFLAKALEQAVL